MASKVLGEKIQCKCSPNCLAGLNMTERYNVGDVKLIMYNTQGECGNMWLNVEDTKELIAQLQNTL